VPSDATTADAAEAGDALPWAELSPEDAIPRLYREQGGRLYSLARRFCGDDDEARDLVQDVFLIAFRSWQSFQGRSSPTTWLYTIASRACQRRHRRRAGQPAHLESLEELLPGHDAWAITQPGPYDDRLRSEAREVVEDALRGLPEAFRMAVVLKDIIELDTREVAEILGVRPGTVKSRVHRGRLLLRRELDRRLGGETAPDPDQPPSICFDLLRAKLDALDRGIDFDLSEESFCSRCAAVFGTLDLAREVCRDLGSGTPPAELRASIEERLPGGLAT
jgi:RNA polymerase sigma-70 factor (ECF subfamily)